MLCCAVSGEPHDLRLRCLLLTWTMKYQTNIFPSAYTKPAASPLSLSSCASRAGIAQRRFLAKKSAGGGKKKGGTPKKGPAAIKARGATPPPKTAGKRGSSGGSGGAAAGGANAKPPTAAAAGGGAGGGGSGGGGGFTKSEMLAARKARKASLSEKSAKAAAAAAAATAAKRAAPAAVTAAGSKGAAAGGAGANAKGKWGWGTRFLAGTSAGLAVLGIAWQLKPDEVRRLLDDSPIDHFAIWLMGKYALVRETRDCFRFLCACFGSPAFYLLLTVVRQVYRMQNPPYSSLICGQLFGD